MSYIPLLCTHSDLIGALVFIAGVSQVHVDCNTKLTVPLLRHSVSNTPDSVQSQVITCSVDGY